jgi:hypothetical protein
MCGSCLQVEKWRREEQREAERREKARERQEASDASFSGQVAAWVARSFRVKI